MRRVLRRREIIDDPWRHWGEDGAGQAGGAGLIVPLAHLRAHPETWAAPNGPLGVRLAPADKVEELSPELARFALVAVEFPSPGEGRGFTQGRLLRSRFGFAGELRAVGAAVKRDYVVPLVRCGFDTLEIAPEEDLAACLEALNRYSVAYQAVGGDNLALRWRARGTPL